MNTVATIQAPPPAPMTTGGSVKPIVPQSMEEAYRLAKAICMAGMAPKGLDTPEKAMVAILHGLEIGLTPMMALQRIAVVNGRPTLWGDGAMALVRGSGLCEFVRERIDGAGDARVAVCTVKRKGETEELARRFSVADAKTAGLWGKSGPWQQFPERMLQMRARAFALRDVFADVLGGMYLREELEDEPRQAPPPAPSGPPPAPQIEHRAAPPSPPQEPADDLTSFYEQLQVALAKADSADEIDQVWADMDVEAVCADDMMVANAIRSERLHAIRGGRR
jgi:hypothetical protein